MAPRSVRRLRQGHPHPENKEITVWQAFEAERPSLVPYVSAFDGFHAVPVSVSKTCLIRFDNNRYSVMASAVGRPVEVRAYAERIELRQGGHVVGEHVRRFGRNETVFEPWHYVPVLARKPGALRNGAPFRIGCCRPPSSASGASSPAPTMAIARWWAC